MAENLEQELSKLEQEYTQKRAEVERRFEAGEVPELPPEKETLREVVREQTEITPEPKAPPVGEEIPSYQLPGVQERVQEFIDIAFNKSISEATEKAKATHNAALIDAFHDALVDNLYDQLVEQGKIKELKLAA